MVQLTEANALPAIETEQQKQPPVCFKTPQNRLFLVSRCFFVRLCWPIGFSSPALPACSEWIDHPERNPT
ncbi:MAG: hypothetical protein CMJ95_08415 [Planctomycetes bacterium]|nr:hypothetical protein [Planctomycetota bacterium]